LLRCMVASECVEQIRDDGGAGDDAGAPWGSLDGNCGRTRPFSVRIRSFLRKPLCANRATTIVWIAVTCCCGAWRTLVSLQEVRPQITGWKPWRKYRRRNGHADSGVTPQLAAGLCDGLLRAGLHWSAVLRAIFLRRHFRSGAASLRCISRSMPSRTNGLD